MTAATSTQTVAVVMARHAWATCAVAAWHRGRCPRCCWCETGQPCDHPTTAWQVKP